MSLLRMPPGLGFFFLRTVLALRECNESISVHQMQWSSLQQDISFSPSFHQFTFMACTGVPISPAYNNKRHQGRQIAFCLLPWHMDRAILRAWQLKLHALYQQITLGGKGMLCFTSDRILCLKRNLTISIQNWKHFQLIGKKVIIFFLFLFLFRAWTVSWLFAHLSSELCF